MKVIAICRISTTYQEIQSQIDELKGFIFSDGVDEKDIEWITGIGVSAVKEDENFRKNIQKVKDLIASGEYSTVYAWELSRIARRKVTMDLLIELLIEKKIQLKIQNPTLSLLNSDGTVNSGMELAISLFTTLAEQEMKNKMERFRRGKSVAKQSGRFVGGRLMYGYDVDSNGFIVPHPVDGDVVKEIFTLYATGRYNTASIAKEMEERGMYMPQRKVIDILAHKQYCDGTYPRLISPEIFQKCETIRKKKMIADRNGKHNYFANRILRCKCGFGYTAAGSTYACSQAKFGGNHSPQISVKYLDGMLWTLASYLEWKALLAASKTDKEKLASEMAVRARKIEAVDSGKAKVEIKRQRALKAYLDGLIDDEEYQDRQKKAKIELSELDSKVLQWKKEMEELEEILNGGDGDSELTRIISAVGAVYASDEKKMEKIVKKWIRRITVDGHAVCVETLNGPYGLVYNAYSRVAKWWTTNGAPLHFQPLERNEEGLVIVGGGIDTSKDDTIQKWFRKEFI